MRDINVAHLTPAYSAELHVGDKISFKANINDPKWFSLVNGALKTNQIGNRVNVEAVAPGKSILLLYDESFALIRKLDISVLPVE